MYDADPSDCFDTKYSATEYGWPDAGASVRLCAHPSSLPSSQAFRQRSPPGAPGTCAFVEYETAGEARKAEEVLEDWKFDKNHSLRVTPHDRARRLRDEVEEELGFASPELEPCRAKADTTSWLEDPCQRDQFAIRHGKETSVHWCDGREAPVLDYDGPRERSNMPPCVVATPMRPLGPVPLTLSSVAASSSGAPSINHMPHRGRPGEVRGEEGGHVRDAGLLVRRAGQVRVRHHAAGPQTMGDSRGGGEVLFEDVSKALGER